MVARIETGKSIRGILNYNENKVENAEAALLMAAGFPRDPAALSFKNKLERFERLTRQNERTHTNALHITLNFSRADHIEQDKLMQIATDYMQRIGFGEQPFLVYQHFDAAHPHIHIATVNIAEGGARIETHNLGKNQSENARKELEIIYGLVKAEDQAKDMAYLLAPVKLEPVRYGKKQTKAAISGIVREVISSYRFTSLPELNAALGQFNVMADRGPEGSKMFQNGGLVYRILSEQGEKIGVPIKASSIYSSPTLKNLERKFAAASSARKPYGERLKFQINKAFKSAKGLSELEAMLRQQGIRILLRKAVTGQVYGITYIDNSTRCVFNGSDLGKEYSARAVMEKLEEKMQLADGPAEVKKEKTASGSASGKSNVETEIPAREQPVITTLLDTVVMSEQEPDLPDTLKRKKKRRIQPE